MLCWQAARVHPYHGWSSPPGSLSPSPPPDAPCPIYQRVRHEASLQALWGFHRVCRVAAPHRHRESRLILLLPSAPSEALCPLRAPLCFLACPLPRVLREDLRFPPGSSFPRDLFSKSCRDVLRYWKAQAAIAAALRCARHSRTPLQKIANHPHRQKQPLWSHRYVASF